jgi:hypothetical protein
MQEINAAFKLENPHAQDLAQGLHTEPSTLLWSNRPSGISVSAKTIELCVNGIGAN